MWRTVDGFLNVISAAKLGQLTNEPKQQSIPLTAVVGSSGKTFTTPFAYGAIVPYFDGAEQTTGFTISRATGVNGRDQLLFAVAPGSVQVTASSPDGINVDVYEQAALGAQALIRGPLDAALWEVPADDADPTTIPKTLLTWFDAITSYLLASDPRRPGLLSVYSELAQRYQDVCGIGGDLSRVAKGGFSLRGVLTYRGTTAPFSPPTDPTPQTVEFSSRPLIYGGGKGIF
jgi:hypothetical protein